jgi:glycosyltransferase involved in cell wall biosynthesis
MPSDIGHFTGRVRAPLSRHCDLRIFADTPRCEGTSLPTPSGELDGFELNAADFDVFNFGNNVDMHADSWCLSLQRSGIAILHDLSYQHFFGMLFLERWNRPDIYGAVMRAYYGSKGRDAAQARIEGSVTASDLVQDFPLTAFAASGACGVVIHHFAHEREMEKMGDVRMLSLPYPATAPQARSGDDRRTDDRRRLVMFGYLGENRRLEQVLNALQRIEERSRLRLDIFGIVPAEPDLHARIRAAGLDGVVNVHGFVEETRLDRALADADLAINLRNPSMGEASGSQLRIWANGLASLVTKHHWYATLPSNAVFFVDPDSEESDLMHHFRALIADPGPYREAGTAGRRILAARHSPGQYADALIEFVRESAPKRAKAALDPTIQRLATADFPWWSSRPTHKSLGSVKRRVASLLPTASHGPEEGSGRKSRGDG